jgi:hypothetical protein
MPPGKLDKSSRKSREQFNLGVTRVLYNPLSICARWWLSNSNQHLIGAGFNSRLAATVTKFNIKMRLGRLENSSVARLWFRRTGNDIVACATEYQTLRLAHSTALVRIVWAGRAMAEYNRERVKCEARRSGESIRRLRRERQSKTRIVSRNGSVLVDIPSAGLFNRRNL